MNTEKSASYAISTSKISGHVYSVDGAVLKGAKVTCHGTETRTLADGLFTFHGLPPRTYEVEVVVQGFRPEVKTVTIRDEEEGTVDFYLSGATGTAKICGHVYDAESKRAIEQGGTVVLVLPIANKYSHVDDNGYYEFRNLPSGTYNVVTVTPEYEDGSAVLSVADNETKSHDFFLKARKIEEPPWG